jgi:hypothetical protein
MSMKATPRYRPHELAPVEDAYVLVDRSGEVLSVSVWRRKGERLPELAVAGSNPIGYIRVGEVEATAKAG